MKRLLFSSLLGCLLLAKAGWSQQIIYQKKLNFGTGIFGEIKGIVRDENQEIMVFGITLGCNCVDGGGQEQLGLFTAKIADNGDTVFYKRYYGHCSGTGMYNGIMAWPNVLTIIYQKSIDVPPYLFNLVIVNISTETGEILNQVNLDFAWPQPKSMWADASGNIYYTGKKAFPSNSQNINLTKITPNGQVLFMHDYVPSTQVGSGLGNNLIGLPGGRLWLSGLSDGPNIVAYTLDTAGNELAYKKFYTNTAFNKTCQEGKVFPSKDSTYIIYSDQINNINPNYRHLMRKVDKNGDILWHGLKQGSGKAPNPTSDGGIFYIYTGNNSQRAGKLRSDSTLEWSFEISEPDPGGGTYRGRFIHDSEFFEDSSALLAGYTVDGNLPYYARIAHVGQPYDPITASKPKIKPDPLASHYAWPNPTTGKMYIQGIGSGTLQFVNTMGQPVIEREYSVGTELDLSLLPAGVYTYTLTTARSKTVGRVVKK